MRLRGPAGPFGHSTRSAMDVPARSSTLWLFAATQRVRSRPQAPKRVRRCKVGQGPFHVKWPGEYPERAFQQPFCPWSAFPYEQNEKCNT